MRPSQAVCPPAPLVTPPPPSSLSFPQHSGRCSSVPATRASCHLLKGSWVPLGAPGGSRPAARPPGHTSRCNEGCRGGSCLSLSFSLPNSAASLLPGPGNLMKRRELSAAPSAVSLGRLRVFGGEGWFQEPLFWRCRDARREELDRKPEGGEFPCRSLLPPTPQEVGYPS